MPQNGQARHRTALFAALDLSFHYYPPSKAPRIDINLSYTGSNLSCLSIQKETREDNHGRWKKTTSIRATLRF